jgi:hypothetical protein
MHPSVVYSLKVWLTSVVLGSFLSCLPFIFPLTDWYELVTVLFGGMLLVMIVAALFSILSWAGLLLSIHLLTKYPFNEKQVKLKLSVIGLLLALAPLLFITGGGLGVDWTDRLAVICYPSLIVAGIWFYRLEPAVLNSIYE